MDKNKLLEGQIALVTGASSGLGTGIAYAFAEAGAKVVVNYHSNKASGEDIAHCIIKKGGDAIAISADVGKEDQVRKMFKEIFAKYGTLDVCMNNAGIQIDQAFHEITMENWYRVIDTHLTGHFICTREAVREFLKRGMRPGAKALGKIICMSSVHDVIPWAERVGYAAAKGGIMLLMKSVAQEYASRKIRCNAISPGAIRTPLNRKAWETPEAEAELMKLIPCKRIGDPPEVGEVAVWLASDLSDYITGTTIYIDGGMTLYPGFEGGG